MPPGPACRELYSEKEVVLEERRLRVDNSPLGPFSEQFALRSFSNNYRRPVIGFADDIQRLGRREVQDFFQRHYGPQSLTIAVAGDVRPGAIRQLAERYFGAWRQPPGSQPPSTCSGGGVGDEALAVPQVPRDQWQYQARSKAGPAVLHAYFRPCVRSPDSVPLDLARCAAAAARPASLPLRAALDTSLTLCCCPARRRVQRSAERHAVQPPLPLAGAAGHGAGRQRICQPAR